MHTYANARDRVQGPYKGCKRVCAEARLRKNNPLPHRESNLCQLHAGTNAQSLQPRPCPIICTDLEVEVEEDDHFTVAGLEEGMFDVVVQDIHLVSSHRREPEP